MLEVLAAGARAVIVPYADEREQEQAVRARMLASHGLIEVVTDDVLTPARLAQALAHLGRSQSFAATICKFTGTSRYRPGG